MCGAASRCGRSASDRPSSGYTADVFTGIPGLADATVSATCRPARTRTRAHLRSRRPRVVTHTTRQPVHAVDTGRRVWLGFALLVVTGAVVAELAALFPVEVDDRPDSDQQAAAPPGDVVGGEGVAAQPPDVALPDESLESAVENLGVRSVRR